MRCTARGDEPTLPETSPTPTADTLPDGQKKDHWTMCPTEIMKAGLKRPVRYEYRHEKCGAITKMPKLCAETYASDPSYYGSTFCCSCGGYFPVGSTGEFVWLDDETKVGT